MFFTAAGDPHLHYRIFRQRIFFTRDFVSFSSSAAWAWACAAQRDTFLDRLCLYYAFGPNSLITFLVVACIWISIPLFVSNNNGLTLDNHCHCHTAPYICISFTSALNPHHKQLFLYTMNILLFVTM
jgi:hypothetical protein